MSDEQYKRNHQEIIRRARPGDYIVYLGYDPKHYNSGAMEVGKPFKIQNVVKEGDRLLITLFSQGRITVGKAIFDRFKLVTIRKNFLSRTPKNKPRNT